MSEAASLLQDQEKQKTPRDIGEFGEKVAADFLVRKGYQLVMSNFKTPIGRNRKGAQVKGEIDLIALENTTLCFIEVKTRSSDELVLPLSAVDVRKQRQITRAARGYRKTFGLSNQEYRFDVVSIVLKGRKAPKTDLIKGFWDELKFKKKNWSDASISY